MHRLLERQGGETVGADRETVDVDSACDMDGRSIGVEHAAWQALEMLGLSALLDEVGFNRRQRCYALGSIIARMAHPGSERENNRWLRRTSAAGEIIRVVPASAGVPREGLDVEARLRLLDATACLEKLPQRQEAMGRRASRDVGISIR